MVKELGFHDQVGLDAVPAAGIIDAGEARGAGQLGEIEIVDIRGGPGAHDVRADLDPLGLGHHAGDVELMLEGGSHISRVVHEIRGDRLVAHNRVAVDLDGGRGAQGRLEHQQADVVIRAEAELGDGARDRVGVALREAGDEFPFLGAVDAFHFQGAHVHAQILLAVQADGRGQDGVGAAGGGLDRGDANARGDFAAQIDVFGLGGDRALLILGVKVDIVGEGGAVDGARDGGPGGIGGGAHGAVGAGAKAQAGVGADFEVRALIHQGFGELVGVMRGASAGAALHAVGAVVVGLRAAGLASGRVAAEQGHLGRALVLIDEVDQGGQGQAGIVGDVDLADVEEAVEGVAEEAVPIIAVVLEDSQAPVGGLAAQAEFSDGGEQVDIKAAEVHVAAVGAVAGEIAARAAGDAEGAVATGEVHLAGEGAIDREVLGLVAAEADIVQKVDLGMEGDVVVHLQVRLEAEALDAVEDVPDPVVVALIALGDVVVALEVEVIVVFQAQSIVAVCREFESLREARDAGDCDHGQDRKIFFHEYIPSNCFEY